jgi:hypothetical protein
MDSTKKEDTTITNSELDANTTQSSIEEEEEFTEEELKKAEEFKDKGNQFFKGKSY